MSANKDLMIFIEDKQTKQHMNQKIALDPGEIKDKKEGLSVSRSVSCSIGWWGFCFLVHEERLMQSDTIATAKLAMFCTSTL